MKLHKAGPAIAAGAALVLTGISGCNLIAGPHRASGRELRPAPQPPAALAVVLANTSAAARSDFRDLIDSAVRPGERLIVLSAATGEAIGSFTAPAAPEMSAPAPPAALPADPSAFQRAQYQHSVRAVDQVTGHDLAALAAAQRRELTRWTARTAAAVLAAGGHALAGDRKLGAAIAAAAASLAALRSAGLTPGTREVIAIIGAAAPPLLYASLGGMEAIVTGVPDAMQDAAWQADLLQAGASQAYVLDQAAEAGVAGVVSSSLRGRPRIVFPLSRVHYGPAQYSVPPAALPGLRQLLRLLTVTHPDATATVNGYTDSVPTPGGNLALSFRRASAVLGWLVRHGVSAGRLLAIGHGAADPVAPSRPGGQPLNRRVVVIVTP